MISNNKSSISVENLNYNYQMISTYRFFDKEKDYDIAHICYQTQLLQVFNMDNFDDSILQKNINTLYLFLQKNSDIDNILVNLSKKFNSYDIFNNESDVNKDNFLIFQLLFSYEFFDVFHECLSNFIININDISKSKNSFNKLILKINS